MAAAAKPRDARSARRAFGSALLSAALTTRQRGQADEWLARYPDDASVMAYIGRSGWNTLRVGAGIPDEELREAVDQSYQLVVSKLPKKHRPAGWDAVAQ